MDIRDGLLHSELTINEACDIIIIIAMYRVINANNLCLFIFIFVSI